MPYIVHSRVERGYTSESVFRIRCIAHGLYLVTKSALLNSCARNDSHTTEEQASTLAKQIFKHLHLSIYRQVVAPISSWNTNYC